MTRAASRVLRVVGLALVLVAVMGFVLVGDGGAWTSHGSVPAGRTAVLVEPSVASVLGPSVRVHVTPAEADDEPTTLFLGRGRADDLAAFAQDPQVVRVVGFDGSRRLRLEDGPAPTSGTPAEWQPPTTVDLWQQQVTGPQARELSWRPTTGARSILVAREDGTPLPALDVTVTWTEGRWFWYPVLALVLGLAMMAGGFLLLGALPLDVVRTRLSQVRAAVASRGPTPADPSQRPSATTRSTSRRAAGESAPPAPAESPVPTPTGPPPGEPSAQVGTATLEDRSNPRLVAVDDPVPEPAHEADEPPLTRRAARERRRKETAWQRARAKAMSRAGGRR